MRDSGPADSTDLARFSAAADRVHAARIYVLWVKPALIAIVAALTLTSWLADPADVPPQLWIVCGTFVVLQLVWVALVHAGRDPLLIAGLSFVADAVLEVVALFSSPEPASSSATIAFFVMASSYFLPAILTIAFAIACSVAITIAAHHVDAWGGAFTVPSTAFLTLATGLLAAFLMSRVRRTESRLERSVLDQRTANEAIEQLARVRDRLIANVSHELRTPLTATIGAVETLMRDDVTLDGASRDRLLQVARDGGHRLLALVEDLLTLGTTRPDSLELAAAEQRLQSLASDAIAGIDPGEGRTLDIVAQDDPLVRVDRLRLIQVIANLVVNAIRYGEGDVLVHLHRQGEHAVIAVIDHGPGIDPSHVDELFLPFARFTSRPDSVGLGLAICRTLVEAHGGTIGYERDDEQRTSFTVRLPVAAGAGAGASGGD